MHCGDGSDNAGGSVINQYDLECSVRFCVLFWAILIANYRTHWQA